MSTLSPKPIKRLLVANRGEIATRIISSARELNIKTFALYTAGDVSHAANATHAIGLPSVASFMSIEYLINIVQKHKIDAVHPGYGFLSESGEFSKRLWDEANAAVVGPGWEILANTGDKLKARQLAERCGVPISPALANPTSDPEDIRRFAARVGYPVMVKAVDGGGGRGIRLIKSEDSLVSNVKRAVEESPSKQLFAEKAAIDGYRHIEVQILGDGRGNVTHLWERECSIQRRYQKIVEFAPSIGVDRSLVARVIEDALKMAKYINYLSLGTFEFLVNPATKEYFFLEVNPRLQVEHTITECISMTDIVKIQLLLAQGASLSTCGLPRSPRDPKVSPPTHSIQLRITAEDVQRDWSLSIGKIASFQFPTGNGIRVDTHLIGGHSAIVSADFDSLIAKLIVTASSWEDAVHKAQRALEDTQISGIKTNVEVLRGIVAHSSFIAGNCDTRWLENKQQELLQLGQKLAPRRSSLLQQDSNNTLTTLSSTNTLFRKGDAWSLILSPQKTNTTSSQDPPPCHLELTRVLQNEFPTSLSADVLFTAPSTPPQPYSLKITHTTAPSSSLASAHPRANPSNPCHIGLPFPGKLVEIMVDEGDLVKEGDVVCVVQQMKMELEVRAPRSGKVTWVTEAEDGEDVGEGLLVVVVEGEKESRL
ncbi:carbamoyl-phosphate synthase L chain, ATP binding domain-containing protein [Dendryphion nanum]|uniref:Carbamoyl-phosphate synthase L chain, ATP binding domain-containing protein n=1 Tax=Dendryphion nanum TaxID=256645 RepID=A0A9P9DIS3_9PLEO|nr:carbamoyl-phosphate synthase L chain, ATP binding domain-containing protein [Dendryphion nanum]